MPDVIRNAEHLLFVDNEMVERVKGEARKSPRLVARLLMHHSHDDPVQEMLIAMRRGCAIPPNRSSARSESLSVVEGQLQIVIFDDQGGITQCVDMGPPEFGEVFLYRMSSAPWHTMIPKSDTVVVHEVLQGPFVQASGSRPEWIPEDPDDLKCFLARIGSTGQ